MNVHDLQFVGWMCPCHRRVIRPNEDGSKPTSHLISKDEGHTQCNVSPDLWMETFVKPPEPAPDPLFDPSDSAMVILRLTHRWVAKRNEMTDKEAKAYLDAVRRIA